MGLVAQPGKHPGRRADYALTTDAEWYGTQAAAAGAASAAANAWRRVPRIMDVSVHHGGGLYQLTYLGWVHWFSPGIFLSAQRDLPGCPYRALMDAGQARAEAAGVVNASPALGNPMQTARAAIVGFVQTVPDAGWELAVCPDAAGVHCRTGVFADWMSLAAVHGCDAAAAASFRLTLGDNFNYFSGKLPNLLEVLRPPISASAFSGHIARMASRCFSPGKEPPSSIADVIELEAQLGHYLVSLGAQAGLITAQQRVDWLCSQPPPSLPGAIDPAGPAAAAGGAAVVGGTELRDVMNTPEVAELVGRLRSELDLTNPRPGQTQPNPTVLSRILAQSRYVILHRFGVGMHFDYQHRDVAAYREVFRRTAELVGPATWASILTTRLVAKTDGTVADEAAEWRLSPANATAIRDARSARRRTHSAGARDARRCCAR